MFKLKNGSALHRLKAYAQDLDIVEVFFRLVITLIIIGFSVLLFISARSPRQPIETYIPADVCMVEGTPRIISIDTGKLIMTYLRNDGATVKQSLSHRLLDGTLKEDSAEVYFGGVCFAEKGNG